MSATSIIIIVSGTKVTSSSLSSFKTSGRKEPNVEILKWIWKGKKRYPTQKRKIECNFIISGPNENSPKASTSVHVLAAGSQDGICGNEHQNWARQ